VKEKGLESAEPLLAPLRPAVVVDLAAVAGDESSEGSDNDVGVLPGTKRRQILASRASKRRRAFFDAILAAEDRGEPMLLSFAVRPNTQKRYDVYLSAFMKHWKLTEQALGQLTPEEMDMKLSLFYSLKFLSGEQASYGEQLAAALMNRLPQYGKLGTATIPRSWRCLRAWKRLTPTRPRKAYPLGVWCGVAVVLSLWAETRMAMFVMTALSLYSRPSSCLGARKCDLIRPAAGVSSVWSLQQHAWETGVANKLNLYDEGNILDSPYLSRLGALYAALAERGNTANLWGFDYPELAAGIRRAAILLGVPELVPYELRHSGVTIDISRSWRDIPAAQRRGGWAKPRSMHRYEHSARLSAVWDALSIEQKRFFSDAEVWMPDVLLGRSHPMRLPAKPLTRK